jgi:fumarate reductase subunit C
VFTKRSWFVFFLREITCLAVAWSAVTFLLLVRSVLAGPDAYAAFLRWLGRPGVVGAHAVVLVAVIWHSVTWFLAAPRAMGSHVLGRKVAPSAVIAGHYAAWAAASAAIWWVLG